MNTENTQSQIKMELADNCYKSIIELKNKLKTISADNILILFKEYNLEDYFDLNNFSFTIIHNNQELNILAIALKTNLKNIVVYTNKGIYEFINFSSENCYNIYKELYKILNTLK